MKAQNACQYIIFRSVEKLMNREKPLRDDFWTKIVLVPLDHLGFYTPTPQEMFALMANGIKKWPVVPSDQPFVQLAMGGMTPFAVPNSCILAHYPTLWDVTLHKTQNASDSESEAILNELLSGYHWVWVGTHTGFGAYRDKILRALPMKAVRHPVTRKPSNTTLRRYLWGEQTKLVSTCPCGDWCINPNHWMTVT